MALGRFAHAARQQYGSQSEYGKSLSSDQKLENFKKLTGNDLNLFDSKQFNGGFGLAGQDQDYKAYMNLFDPVKTGGGFNGRGAKATGEYTLKADTKGKWGGGSDNAAMAQKLKDALTNKAYDKAVGDLYETGDVSAEEASKLGPADFGMKWEHRTNRLTGETETIQDKDQPRESNFWRRNKENAIRAGGAIAGGVVGSIVPVIGTAYGAAAGASLADTTRKAYAARADRRKILDLKRDWENDPRNQPWQPTGGRLYQSAGEGVVEYNTKDVEKKKKGTYLKEGTE